MRQTPGPEMGLTSLGSFFPAPTPPTPKGKGKCNMPSPVFASFKTKKKHALPLSAIFRWFARWIPPFTWSFFFLLFWGEGESFFLEDRPGHGAPRFLWNSTGLLTGSISFFGSPKAAIVSMAPMKRSTFPPELQLRPCPMKLTV